MRRLYVKIWLAIISLSLVAAYIHPLTTSIWIILGPIFLLGLRDYTQKKRSVLRNWPILGHFRYLFEMIRPEIYQYFIESDNNGVPFNRENRSLVYARSKQQLSTVPFGTKVDIYQEGYEFVNHSLAPAHVSPEKLRVKIGGPNCKKPYNASLLNISAMSFGSLSPNAIKALNQGAFIGGFAHCTGEGSISNYHRMGGDLIWQIGTGYFGCRTTKGNFDTEKFSEKASDNAVKMIEIKLSQGAKPGHGGILPKEKITPEIKAIRGVSGKEDVISPPAHTAFKNPIELMMFIKQLRELSGGKPIGIKLCIGKRREFLSICKAMKYTNCFPDYIAIDGGEGGTGAAPLEFCDHIGSPLKESLIFVHNALKGFKLRDHIKIIASGKITSGFEILSYLAIGADLCYAARAFMLSLGCIQALKCHSNECPVGVATQNKELVGGLVADEKAKRVLNFHKETLTSTAEIMGAMGINNTEGLNPWHMMRRVDRQTIKHYGELYEFIDDGSLLEKPYPIEFKRAMELATHDSFYSKEATSPATSC